MLFSLLEIGETSRNVEKCHLTGDTELRDEDDGNDLRSPIVQIHPFSPLSILERSSVPPIHTPVPKLEAESGHAEG